MAGKGDKVIKKNSINKIMRFGVARKYAKDLQKYIMNLIQKEIFVYEMGFAYGIPDEIPKEVIGIIKNITLHYRVIYHFG